MSKVPSPMSNVKCRVIRRRTLVATQRLSTLDVRLWTLRLFESFHDDQLGFGGRLTKSFRFSVFGRTPPGFRLIHGRELGDDQALRRPFAFEVFNLAAAHKKTAAVHSERRRHHLLVVFVSNRIFYFNFDNDVSGHLASP